MMHWRGLLPFRGLVLLACSAIAGCSGSLQPWDDQTEQPQQRGRTISAEDKRVAQSLSAYALAEDAGTAVENRDVLCSTVFPELLAKLREANALTAEQDRALREVKAVFDRRALTGRSPAELAAARRAVIVSHPEPASRMRAGLACLKSLMPTGA